MFFINTSQSELTWAAFSISCGSHRSYESQVLQLINPLYTC